MSDGIEIKHLVFSNIKNSNINNKDTRQEIIITLQMVNDKSIFIVERDNIKYFVRSLKEVEIFNSYDEVKLVCWVPRLYNPINLEVNNMEFKKDAYMFCIIGKLKDERN